MGTVSPANVLDALVPGEEVDCLLWNFERASLGSGRMAVGVEHLEGGSDPGIPDHRVEIGRQVRERSARRALQPEQGTAPDRLDELDKAEIEQSLRHRHEASRSVSFDGLIFAFLRDRQHPKPGVRLLKHVAAVKLTKLTLTGSGEQAQQRYPEQHG